MYSASCRFNQSFHNIIQYQEDENYGHEENRFVCSRCAVRHSRTEGLGSKYAKKGYVHATAAALRAKDSVMTTVTAVRESADDICAEAKAIGEQSAEAEAAAVIEDVADEANSEESKAECNP